MPASQPKPPGSARPDFHTLHLWQMQPVRDLLVIALVVGVIYLGKVLSPVTVPMLLALTLAYLFEPLVLRLKRRRRMSRPVASGLIVVLIVFTVAVPIVIGGAFATVQGASYAVKFWEQGLRLQRIAANPNDQTALNELGEGSWRSIGEYIQKAGLASQADAAGQSNSGPKSDPATGPATDSATDPEANPATDSSADGALDKRDPAPGTAPGTTSTGASTGASTGTPAPPTGTDPPPSTGQIAALPSAVKPDLPPDVKAALKAELKAELKPELKQEIINGGAPHTSGERLSRFDSAVAYITNWAQDNTGTIGRVTRQLFGTGAEAFVFVANFLKSAALLGFSLFLTMFFFFFFSSRWGDVREGLISMIPAHNRSRWIELAERMDTVIAAFIRGRLTIMAILSGLYIVSYWIIGVPAPLAVGLMVGILSAVPYLPLIGIPVSILLMFLMPVGDPHTPLYIFTVPVITYALIQMSDDYLWTPLIQGKATDMDTPTILFAVLSGALLAGFYGVLLAIPIGACFKIVIKEVLVPRFREWAEGRATDILPIAHQADAPAPPPPAAPPTLG